MNAELIMQLGLILLLIVGNAFFVGSEIALTSARRSRIKQLADTGNKAAKTVQLLHKEPERFYSVTQIGITLVSLGLGATGMVTISQLLDPMFERLFDLFGDHTLHKGLITMAHTASYAMAFVIISFLHVVAGELAPKVLAFHKAESLSLTVAWIINGLYKMFKWLIWIMNKSSNGLLWLFGQRNLSGHGEGHFAMSEEEIRTILSASEQDGVLNSEETMMIRGVFDLDEHTVREAMIPRTDLLAVSCDATIAEVLRLFKNTHHARYPVYDANLDNMVGVVAIKELLSSVSEQEKINDYLEQKVSEIMLPPFLVPETKALSELLKTFKKQRQHMAIVIDEFGGTAGIITLEDILEEIVGDFDDEFTHTHHRLIKKLEGSEYLVNASIRVSEMEPVLNFPFPEGDDYVTLAGLIYKHLGGIPQIGSVVNLDGGRLEVAEMEGHRITKVKFQDLAINNEGQLDLAEKPEAAPDPLESSE